MTKLTKTGFLTSLFRFSAKGCISIDYIGKEVMS